MLSGDRDDYLALAALEPGPSARVPIVFWTEFGTDLERIRILLGDGTIWTYSTVRREVWECD